MSHASILLIGCGKMGQAMLSAWIDQNIIQSAVVVDPNIDRADLQSPCITAHQDITALPADQNFTMIIVAVKPQIMDGVLVTIQSHLNTIPPLMSIAAGKSIASITEALGAQNHPVIRVMPNTPAAIGKGMSVAVANPQVNAKDKDFAERLLASCGCVEWIDDEAMLNAVTALSGSGPAYIFHLIETLERAGTKIGLPEKLSSTLARQTVIGAAALAEHDMATPASTLRENVTSKGGTTAAALNVLMNGDVQDIYNAALKAAKTRGEELDS